MKVYEFVVGLSVFLSHSLPSIIGAEKCFGRPSARNKLPSEMLTSGASEYDDDDVEALVTIWEESHATHLFLITVGDWLTDRSANGAPASFRLIFVGSFFVCNSVRRKPGPGKLVINGLIISSATMEKQRPSAGIVKKELNAKPKGWFALLNFA